MIIKMMEFSSGTSISILCELDENMNIFICIYLSISLLLNAPLDPINLHTMIEY